MTFASATPTADYVVKALGTGKIAAGWLPSSVSSAILAITGIEDTITAHAGGTQASAFALDGTKGVHHITVCATAGDSVRLPTLVVDEHHYVHNSGAASAQVYGAGTDTINDVATATGVTLAAGTGAIFAATSAGKWYAFGLSTPVDLNSPGPIGGTTPSTIQATTLTTTGNIELGNASDTTISRASAGVIAVEGVNVLMNGGALGTPSSGTLTNATGLPVSGITASTSTALGVGSIELGHASDTTIARDSAGLISVETKVVHLEGNAIGATTPAAGTFTTLTANVGSPDSASAQVISADGTLNPRGQIEQYDHFLGADVTTSGLIWTTSSSSGTVAINNSTIDGGNGVVSLTSGTGASNRAAIVCGPARAYLLNGVVKFATRVYVPTLSNATDEFKIRIGHMNGTSPDSAIFLSYDRATDGANWYLVCMGSAGTTKSSTGVAVAAGAWTTLQFVVNAAGTSVQAYVAGAAAGSPITTNIPTTASGYRNGQGWIRIDRIAGNGGLFYVDYFYNSFGNSSPG